MYFVLAGCSPSYPCRWIDRWPFIKGLKWGIGQRHQQSVPVPLEFPLKRINPSAADHGSAMPPYFRGTIPLFRNDLIATLKSAGVDNIDFYSARVVDSEDGSVNNDYMAGNIVGAVSLADLSRSIYTASPGGPIIDVEFDHFEADPAKYAQLLMFRLAESTGTIMVHSRVRDKVLADGFTMLDFLDPMEAAV